MQCLISCLTLSVASLTDTFSVLMLSRYPTVVGFTVAVFIYISVTSCLIFVNIITLHFTYTYRLCIYLFITMLTDFHLTRVRVDCRALWKSKSKYVLWYYFLLCYMFCYIFIILFHVKARWYHTCVLIYIFLYVCSSHRLLKHALKPLRRRALLRFPQLLTRLTPWR